jgi:hypothetical protein
MLSNYDIINICKKLKINLNGVYSKDDYENINLENGFYIVNLQDSTDGNGTHWCLFAVSNYEHLYFDSYGFPAPEIIENILNDTYLWNDTQIQHLDSNACGWFCIAFMFYMQNTRQAEPRTLSAALTKGKNKEKYKNFINIFDKNNLMNNDKILYEFIKYIIS